MPSIVASVSIILFSISQIVVSYPYTLSAERPSSSSFLLLSASSLRAM